MELTCNLQVNESNEPHHQTVKYQLSDDWNTREEKNYPSAKTG